MLLNERKKVFHKTLFLVKSAQRIQKCDVLFHSLVLSSLLPHVNQAPNFQESIKSINLNKIHAEHLIGLF